MERPRSIHAIALMASALALTACTEQAQQEVRQAVAEAKAEVEAATAENGTVAQAIEEDRRKLREENLPIGHGGIGPKAEITPQGEFLIDGKALPLTDAQREAVKRFRDETIEVADAGMAMGLGGAALAGQTIGSAVAGLLGKDISATSERLEAEATKMQEAGLSLCRKAKALGAAKDALAEVLPEFRPYAETMKVDATCGDDTAPEALTEAETTATTSA
ncbi:hypothetical protein [Silanimonas sp.]|jgi:hypothetical protein|uniref:hypothetical protein n=1 Tax=Silanimonas sp. TaxID=1929290 RepID=UPI0022BDC366|nr:hypothetical protein [Silanimonas sp.]MCZ8113726.1 hypothetical protein [Silanimonas sp.]